MHRHACREHKSFEAANINFVSPSLSWSRNSPHIPFRKGCLRLPMVHVYLVVEERHDSKWIMCALENGILIEIFEMLFQTHFLAAVWVGQPPYLPLSREDKLTIVYDFQLPARYRGIFEISCLDLHICHQTTIKTFRKHANSTYGKPTFYHVNKADDKSWKNTCSKRWRRVML